MRPSRSILVLLLLACLVVCVQTSPAPAASGWNGFGAGSWPGPDWRPYATGSPFNRRTTDATVHPRSAWIVKYALGLGRIGGLVAGTADTPHDWGHPTFYAQPTDPLFTLVWTGGGPRLPSGTQIRVPDAARPAGGGDRHLTVVEPDGWEYDFWDVRSKQPGGGTLTYGGGGRTRIDGRGLASGGTAAGFGNLAGVIRAPELAAGRIDHALFIVLQCAAEGTGFGYGTRTSTTSSYVYPATHGGMPCATDGPDVAPLGARFMLAMSDEEIAALPVPDWKKTVLTALAHYGGYVGDTGGPGFGFLFESSTTYTAFGQADPLVAFAELAGIAPWNGRYSFRLSSDVAWQRYLRVLTPPAP